MIAVSESKAGRYRRLEKQGRRRFKPLKSPSVTFFSKFLSFAGIIHSNGNGLDTVEVNRALNFARGTPIPGKSRGTGTRFEGRRSSNFAKGWRSLARDAQFEEAIDVCIGYLLSI